MTRLVACRAGAVAAVAAIALALLGVPAEAVQYRYWSYWWGAGGGWSFAPAGASHPVKDGDVEGWRFGVGGVGSAPLPRVAASFNGICGGQPQAEGKVRVALVVDYGTPTDAPPGQGPPGGVDTLCAVVSTSNATGFAVLGQYGGVRQDRGLICAINGYPAGECAAAVEQPKPEPNPQPNPEAEPKPEPQPEPKPEAEPKPEPGPSTPGDPTVSTGRAGGESQSDPGDGGQLTNEGAGPTSARESEQQDRSDAATNSATEDAKPDADAVATATGSAALLAGASPSSTPAASPTRSDGAQALAVDDGPPFGPWVTIGALMIAAVLGGTAWWRSRSRRA